MAMAVATLWMLTLGTQAELEQAAVPKGTNPRPHRPAQTSPTAPLVLFCARFDCLADLVKPADTDPDAPLVPQPTLALVLNSS
ncbi:hypothetical protein NIES2104_09540 [Leptolyngbya sp. NIES-2104]|nr:hypothetical protein NIES2104_09540 [Leptolyngbya sp. NIES-2104]